MDIRRLFESLVRQVERKEDHAYTERQIVVSERSNLISLWALIISVLSLVVSAIYGCQSNRISNEALKVSQEANFLSKKSLKSSEESFIVSNRPYLNAELTKFDETGQYLSVHKSDDIVYIQIKFLLTNVGNTPALNIRLPKESSFGSDSIKSSKQFSVDMGNHFTLGPKQSHPMTVKIGVGSKSGQTEKLFEELKDEINKDIYTLNVQIVWFYESPLIDTQAYKTLLSYKIKTNEARLIRGESF